MRRTMTAMAFAMTAATAQAATFEALPTLTDTQFNDLLASGAFFEEAIAESRGGNAATNGTFELDIQDVTGGGPGGTPDPTAQFAWGNGTTYDFTLDYDGTDLSYSVGGVTLTKTLSRELPAITDILIRTRSDGQGDSFVISDLVVDGTAFAGSLVSDDADTINYLRVSGLSTTFSMSGTQTLSWTDGAFPSNSRLAAQFKIGGTPAPIPVPAALPLLAAGMGALVAVRRRRR